MLTIPNYETYTIFRNVTKKSCLIGMVIRMMILTTMMMRVLRDGQLGRAGKAGTD